MNDKRDRITIELKGDEVPNVLRSLDFTASTILKNSPDALYNVQKVMVRIEYAIHKGGHCDAEKYGTPCAFQDNINGFKEDFQKQIADDPDFAEGGEDAYVITMFGGQKKSK